MREQRKTRSTGGCSISLNLRKFGEVIDGRYSGMPSVDPIKKHISLKLPETRVEISQTLVARRTIEI
jgi:hypothetical protein